MLNEEQQKELMSWVNREINISLEQIKKSTHYVKARNQAYVNALKKVQARLDGHHLNKNV